MDVSNIVFILAQIIQLTGILFLNVWLIFWLLRFLLWLMQL
jgi:hypothetical protein